MSKKVLVADNDFFFVEFLTDLLEGRGYEVTKAYDGKEAISKLEEGPIDLLFVDMVMPKIDGTQVIRYIRKKFRSAYFPIVVISATIIEQLDMVDKIGADYYIVKGPMEQMAVQINKFIEKLETQPFPFPSDQHLFEADHLYPRQATADLINILNFQRAITESVGVGVIVIDKDAKIINANSLALEILDKSLEDVLNSPVTTIFPKNGKGVLVAGLKKVIQDQTLTKLAFSFTIYEREIRTIVSLFKVDGEIAGWILAVEDKDQWAGPA
jgi:PAS domain S-box-containing protein